MSEVATVTAVSDQGLVADASFGRRSRQVLFIDFETLKDFGVQPGNVRENKTLEGFDLSVVSLQEMLKIGQSILSVSGACEPCSMLDDLRPGLSSEMKGNRGILARVIRGGELRVGDLVSLDHGENEPQDDLS
jgi:MOSC domain-containing protein YiiM